MSLEEYKIVMEAVGNKISPDAKIISGAKISSDMEKSIKVMLIVTGVQSNQILGSNFDSKIKGGNLKDELGINFVEE